MSDVATGAYVVGWLPEAWFVLLFTLLAVYLVLDGFDFGVGILYATRDDETERETFHAAFGPIWKANEVWLVLFVTILFAAYPAVYANLLSRHYLLVFLLLAGLILRGIGVKLRKERDDERWKRNCDRAFVLGSVLSPVLLGAFVVRWVLGDVPPGVDLLGGLALLALSVVLGAAFLTLKTREPLRDEMATWVTAGSAGYALLFVAFGAVLLATGSAALEPVALAGGATALGALVVVAASRTQRRRLAFTGAAGLAVAFVALVAALLYPAIDPAADLAIREAIVSPTTLHVTTLMAAIFLPAVGLGFAMLYSIFEGVAEPTDGY